MGVALSRAETVDEAKARAIDAAESIEVAL